jgi:hypothetical protein
MTIFKRVRRGELDAGAVEFTPRSERSWTAHGARPVAWAACITQVPLHGMHLVMVNIQWGDHAGPAFTVQGNSLIDAAARGARLAADLLTAYARQTVVPERPVVLHIQQPFSSEGATCTVQFTSEIEKVEA